MPRASPTVLKAVGAGGLTFILVFLVLRAGEYGYHRWRRTRDWSPHWGSWVFALLAGVFVLVSDLGR